MTCPLCGRGILRPNVIKSIPYSYRGHNCLLHVETTWCPDCHEMILDEKQAEEMEAQMQSFKQKVDKGAAIPA